MTFGLLHNRLLPFFLVVATVVIAERPVSASDRSLLLANADTAHYRIVTPPAASPAERLAAVELARYLGAISGATFEAAHEVRPRSIVVCEQKSLATLDPEAAVPSLPPDGFAIFSRDENIHLVGADARGVLHAVYRFLEELGCRWLAPAYEFYDGSHEMVPSESRLTYLSKTSVMVESPALPYRKLYVEEGRSHTTANLLQLIEWMPKLGFNVLVFPTDYQGENRVKWDDWREALTPELQRRGIVIEVGGHGYQNFLNADMENGRLFETHPEWFGMEEGKRTARRKRVFCTSNDDAVAYLQRHVLVYLRERPEIEIFDFWPPDGARWCECPACAALGGVPERHARLVAQMGAKLAEELPRVRLECIAYGHYREPPEAISFGDDVLVDFCPIAQVFEYQIYEDASPTNVTYRTSLKAWLDRFGGDISVYSYYRKYAWRSLPVLLPHYMQRDLAWYREQGVRGISIYGEPGDWGTYEVNHYILGRLAWEPGLDVSRELERYLLARYGSASEVAAAAVEKLERVIRRGANIPGTRLKTVPEYEAWVEEISQSIAAVEKEEDRLAGDRPITQALRRLNLMQRYALHNLHFQREVAANAPADEKRRRVSEIADLIEAHPDEGVFLVPPRLTRERLYRYYGVEK